VSCSDGGKYIDGLLDIFVITVGLSPGGSSTVHIYTEQQYTEQRNNTESTTQNMQNNKNTTEIQYTHDKSYLNLSKINQKQICPTQNAQSYK
jgi:hypothetical protein